MAAEDGRCVICRRGDEAAERGDSPTSVTSLLWTAVAGFLCLAIVVGYWKYSAKKDDRPTEPVRADVPAAQAPDPGEVQRPKAVEAQKPEVGGAILDDTPPPPPPSAEDPAAADKALDAAKKAVPIRLYSTSWCPHCKRARAFLTREGYAFEDHDIEASETDKALLRSINPAGGVPTFDVAGHVIVGFDPASFDAQLTQIARARLAKAEETKR